MKKNLTFTFALWLLSGLVIMAQNLSAFRVQYMVTYDKTKDLFTAWVVPEYSTPNYNNGSNEEKGATAQFTIRVPQSFVISQIQDVKGNWDKSPAKIKTSNSRIVNNKLAIKGTIKGIVENEEVTDPYSYYVLGKAPSETNYGQFLENEPVALFHFKGKGGNINEVAALESSDPFIKIADESLALNIGNSFYSRSGQKPTVQATPLEQFAAPIQLATVLDRAARKVGAAIDASSDVPLNENVVAYPNPALDNVTVRYFSQQEGGNLLLDVVDIKGNSFVSKKITTKLGFNTIRLDVSKLESGSYVIKALQGNNIDTKKITKIAE